RVAAMPRKVLPIGKSSYRGSASSVASVAARSPFRSAAACARARAIPSSRVRATLVDAELEADGREALGFLLEVGAGQRRLVEPARRETDLQAAGADRQREGAARVRAPVAVQAHGESQQDAELEADRRVGGEHR